MAEQNLMLFEGVQEEKWYTIDELAELTGYETSHSMQSNPSILELLNQFSNSKDVKTGGYHNRQKFYSENVLKALKQYQLRNSAPNAVKNKEAVITGNTSFVMHETQSQTIAAILNDPAALLELAMQSSRKLIEITKEVKELKTTNNLLMHTKKTYTASELAKELGMKSAIEFNKWLAGKGVQYKRTNTWLPVSKYSDKDYYEIKQKVLDSGKVVYNSRITQAGREFVLKLFETESKAL